jgi:HAD superfamily hydrolase (TIGR01509 family)
MAYFGQTWTDEDQASSIGGPIERVVAHMASRTGADPGHLARVLVTEIEHKVATTPARWMPGARDLMAAAQAEGMPVAIVSNSWRVLLDLLMDNIDKAVHLSVSSTDVDRPKPDPQPYLQACRELGVDPRRCVVIEDSPTGAAAGIAAGCAVLGVGPAVGDITGDRFRHVDSLADVTLESLSGDGRQDPQA